MTWCSTLQLIFTSVVGNGKKDKQVDSRQESNPDLPSSQRMTVLAFTPQEFGFVVFFLLLR